jgi:putative transposase
MASPSEALAPLGVSPPTRATLAEAHERRPAALDQSLFATRYARGQAVAPGHGFRFKNPLLALDSTTISRCLNLCPWARFRTANGAIKGHTLLDHAGHLPAVVVMTDGQGSDIAMACGLPRPKGSIVAMDRGDIDDRFLCRLTQDGVYVVTRQQINATCQVAARLAVTWLQGVTSDQHVVLRGQHSHAYPDALRRVGYRAPETGNHDVFWTTAFHLAAATIAARYTARWQIELVFKTITPHLKIKTFLGTSEHAVMTPIWIARITYLMLAFLRCKSGLGLSFQQLLRLLQIHLFDRRKLVELCHPPPRQASQGQQLYAA